MRHVLRAYAAFLKAGMAVMFHYRGEIILWAVWGLVNPAVLYALWKGAAEGNLNGQVAGFTGGQFAAYFLVIMIVGHFTTAWDVYEMGHFVRTGRLSPLLLLPIKPIWRSLADNTAYKLTTLIFVAPMWLLFAWIVAPAFEAHPWQIGLGVVSLLLAAALAFVLGYVVALAAFWATQLDALGEIYFALGMFLGGRLSPLSALPVPVYRAAWLMPFRWIYAFPAELLIGKVADRCEALAGLGIQLVWLAAAAVAFRVLWGLAVRRYTAVSG